MRAPACVIAGAMADGRACEKALAPEHPLIDKLVGWLMGALTKRHGNVALRCDVRGAFVAVFSARLAVFVVLFVFAVFAPSNAFASAVVVHRAQARPVITNEKALVVYHEDSAVQHLFMQARFEHVKQGFSWWIPVPAVPLPNGEDGAFASIATGNLSVVLTSLARSFCVRARQFVLKDRLFSPNHALQHPCDAEAHVVLNSPDSAPHPSSPHPSLDPGTLASARVFLRSAPLRTLRQLRELLLESGQVEDLALQEYLARYVGDGASIVIVEVSPNLGAPSDDILQTSWTSPVIAVRFSAETPWYPYREPSFPNLYGGADQQRSIRVTVLSGHQRELKLGPSKPTSAYTWLAFEPQFTEVSDAFAATGADLAMAPLGEHERRWWAASFEDEGFVRAGDDDWLFENAGKIPDNPYAIDNSKARPKAAQPVVNRVTETADAKNTAPELVYGMRKYSMKWRRRRLSGSSRDLRCVAPVALLFSALVVAFARRMLGDAAVRKNKPNN